ncbi:MAG: hypothetical protein KA742_16475 [Pseudoxanthomonas sp.]|nr:hypothetical protein [Pseudoxanthomonas sp.]
MTLNEPPAPDMQTRELAAGDEILVVGATSSVGDAAQHIVERNNEKLAIPGCCDYR